MFEQNEKLWQKRIEDYKRTSDRILTFEELNALSEQRQKERQNQEDEKKKAKREAEIREWNTLQQNLKFFQGYVDEYRGKVQQWERSVSSTQTQIEKMLADGFEVPPPPVVVEKPKPVAPKPAPVVSEPEAEEPLRKDYQPCSVCGEKVTPGIAFHRLVDSGGSMICVIDPARTKRAGIYSGLIEEALERQRIAKENI